jgi:hypothetical protein
MNFFCGIILKNSKQLHPHRFNLKTGSIDKHSAGRDQVAFCAVSAKSNIMGNLKCVSLYGKYKSHYDCIILNRKIIVLR